MATARAGTPRRTTPLRALAVLLALLGLSWPTATAAPATPPAAAATTGVELQRQVFDIARQLRCPVCVAESVADSNADVSQQMRRTIQQLLQQGRTEGEILAHFQARYGDWILLDPPKRGLHLLVWLLPPLAALAGLATLAWLMRRWTRSAQTPPDEVDEADLQRVREALEGRS